MLDPVGGKKVGGKKKGRQEPFLFPITGSTFRFTQETPGGPPGPRHHQRTQEKTKDGSVTEQGDAHR